MLASFKMQRNIHRLSTPLLLATMAATEEAATARPTTTFFNANDEYIRTIKINKMKGKKRAVTPRREMGGWET